MFNEKRNPGSRKERNRESLLMQLGALELSQTKIGQARGTTLVGDGLIFPGSFPCLPTASRKSATPLVSFR